METKHLFEGEEIITQSDDKTVTLTTHRLRYNSSSYDKAHIISIMLEKISSIEIHYKSWILFLLAGIIIIAGGLLAGANNQGEAMSAGIFVGLILVVIYYFTRRHVVTIASDGGANINFQTKGMKRETIIDFINKIEKAKNKKMNATELLPNY
jgi:hypothetical protein